MDSRFRPDTPSLLTSDLRALAQVTRRTQKWGPWLLAPSATQSPCGWTALTESHPVQPPCARREPGEGPWELLRRRHRAGSSRPALSSSFSSPPSEDEPDPSLGASCKNGGTDAYGGADLGPSSREGTREGVSGGRRLTARGWGQLRELEERQLRLAGGGEGPWGCQAMPGPSVPCRQLSLPPPDEVRKSGRQNGLSGPGEGPMGATIGTQGVGCWPLVPPARCSAWDSPWRPKRGRPSTCAEK